jgi:hypothetical protein
MEKEDLLEHEREFCERVIFYLTTFNPVEGLNKIKKLIETEPTQVENFFWTLIFILRKRGFEIHIEKMIFWITFILQNNPMTNKETVECLFRLIPKFTVYLEKLIEHLNLLQLDYLFAETIITTPYSDDDDEKITHLYNALEQKGANLNYNDNLKCMVFQHLLQTRNKRYLMRNLIHDGVTLRDDMFSNGFGYSVGEYYPVYHKYLNPREIVRLRMTYDEYNKFNILKKKIFENIHHNCDLHFNFDFDLE